MRKTTIYYSLILAGALALCGCQEKVPAPGNGVLDAEIFLSAGTPATKGFIDSQEQFDNTATMIKVYDFVTGSDGEAGTAEAKHIDDAIHGLIARDGTWAYTSGDTHYHWTKKGTHRFFGWLTTAPDGTAFASASAPTWTEGFKTLSIPLTMDTTTPQFDFVYSDIVTRDGGLMNPNHYLATAIDYLFRNRPGWRKDAAVGKTLVSSAIIDRVAASLGRRLSDRPRRGNRRRAELSRFRRFRGAERFCTSRSD